MADGVGGGEGLKGIAISSPQISLQPIDARATAVIASSKWKNVSESIKRAMAGA